MIFRENILLLFLIVFIHTCYTAEIINHRVLTKSHSTSEVDNNFLRELTKSKSIRRRFSSIRFKKIAPTHQSSEINAPPPSPVIPLSNDISQEIDFTLPGSTLTSTGIPLSCEDPDLITNNLRAMITQSSLLIHDLQEASSLPPLTQPQKEAITALQFLLEKVEEGHTKCQITLETLDHLPYRRLKPRKSFSWSFFKRKSESGE